MMDLCGKMFLVHREVTEMCSARLEDADGLHIGNGEARFQVRTTHHGGTNQIVIQPIADHLFIAKRYARQPRVTIYKGDTAIAYYPVGAPMHHGCTLRYQAG